MDNTSIERMAAGVSDQYEEGFRGQFPYTDCRKLLSIDTKLYEGLIPDLDLYFSDIAGYCSNVKRISKWSDERLREARKTLGRSFFEKHKRYEPLKLKITKANTPQLYERLTLSDQLRIKLLELLSFIDNQ